MPRVMTVDWRIIDPADEQKKEREWRERRDQLAKDGCKHWVFRSPSDPSAYLEFIEAGDASVLKGARERAGMEPNDEILTELELS
jgi:hypothetical protein